jgi:signal transduction histidine kinase
VPTSSYPSAFGWQPTGHEDAFARTTALDELIQVHEYERQRMGQELHDSAGQLVVALQLSLAHLKRVQNNVGLEGLMEEIQDTVTQIDREIRSLAFLHYPAELDGRDLCSAVRTLANGFGRRTGISTSFKASGDTARIDPSTSMALLRVAQEALVNIRRHSHASLVKVLLKRRAGCVELDILDNGIGMDVDALTEGHGIGLQGMRHRMEKLGGHFQISNLRHGTRVLASVPA